MLSLLNAFLCIVESFLSRVEWSLLCKEFTILCCVKSWLESLLCRMLTSVCSVQSLLEFRVYRNLCWLQPTLQYSGKRWLDILSLESTRIYSIWIFSTVCSVLSLLKASMCIVDLSLFCPDLSGAYSVKSWLYSAMLRLVQKVYCVESWLESLLYKELIGVYSVKSWLLSMLYVGD